MLVLNRMIYERVNCHDANGARWINANVIGIVSLPSIEENAHLVRGNGADFPETFPIFQFTKYIHGSVLFHGCSIFQMERALIDRTVDTILLFR